MRSTLKSLLATLFVLALAACGRDEPPPPQTQPAPTAAQAAPTTPPPSRGPETPTGPITEGEYDTEGDLTARERSAIESESASGEATTDEDGTDAQGNVRTHMESETADAEDTETPEEHEIEEDDEDGRQE